MDDLLMCDVCGAWRKPDQVDEVPGIGWMCKPELECSPSLASAPTCEPPE